MEKRDKELQPGVGVEEVWVQGSRQVQVQARLPLCREEAGGERTGLLLVLVRQREEPQPAPFRLRCGGGQELLLGR